MEWCDQEPSKEPRTSDGPLSSGPTIPSDTGASRPAAPSPLHTVASSRPPALTGSVPTVITSVDLELPVSVFPTGWGASLHRRPKISVRRAITEFAKPRVIPVRLKTPSIKTVGFTFPESPAWSDSAQKTKQPPPARRVVGQKQPTRKTATRIAPPGDIIKLQDRLYYVLQPSLESLVASSSLEFPFEPFPYQLEGIAFLYPRYSAILADEMGLGKTMQAIVTIRLLLCSAELRSVLLICPKPLVTNWHREFAMWAADMPVAIIEGDRARREWQWRAVDVPVKIANYELLLRDRDIIADRSLQFDLVVLDEAQRIKNRSSATSQVVRAISRTRSWALTGTPVENGPDDLVGIFDFLSRGYLSPGMRPRQMAKATRDYMLRRTKDVVMEDMPPKLFRDAELELTPEQRATYGTAETDGVLRLEGMGAEITIQHVFELVLRLKQICNFDPATGASSKIERLEADLEEVAASGQKAIIFSQWVHTLTKLRDRLRRFGPLEYHGKVPTKQRDGVIDQFKNDSSKHVILMTYGAGSVGLNLQFCRYVFLFDRWWNPAVEDQAINRAHRIGVAGSVTVTRMLTVETIEERINQILEEKRELFDLIFSQGGAPPSNVGLTQNEIFGLFDLRTPQGPIRKIA